MVCGSRNTTYSWCRTFTCYETETTIAQRLCETLKICDFGTVRLKTTMTENTGSLIWTAPEKIGRGAFGLVYKANWQGSVIAVEDFFPNTEKKREELEKELTQSFRIKKHPNIVDVYGVSLKNGHTYLLMEYAYEGSLQRVLFGSAKEEYTTERVISWMYQCAQGVAFLHATKPKPLLHRDLKPGNLLLTAKNFETLKICDFGTLSELKTTMTENKGTLAWTAPEVFGNGKYTEKCDVFSFSIILWEAFTREKYFRKFPSIMTIPDYVRKGGRPELRDEWPDQLKILMTSCWHENPSKRPFMKDVVLEMKRLLVHQLFNGFADAIDGADGNEIIAHCSISPEYLCIVKTPPTEMRIFRYIGDIKEILVLERLTSLSSIEKEAFEKGWFGITYKAQVEEDDRRKMLALKVYNRQYSNMDYKLCDCISYDPNTCELKILDLYFTFSHKRQIYYGLEYVEIGSLYKILHLESKPYSKMDALYWVINLSWGLAYIHHNNIFMNMLTSRNIFLNSSGKLKIGLPVEEEEANFFKTTYKSAAWMAPEVHEDGKYSDASDIYSLGIIIWEIINRQIPFESCTPDQIAVMVKRGKRPPLKDEDKSIKKLLRSCWERDPLRRTTSSSVYITLWDYQRTFLWNSRSIFKRHLEWK